MPELPEVETIRRQLDKILPGKIIKNVSVLREKSFQGDAVMMQGFEVEKVNRRSKVLEIYFKNRDVILLIHLKMTGQLIYIRGNNRIVGGHPTADWINELPSKHTRVIWSFTDGSKLFFNDMRVFGWMKLLNREDYEEKLKTVPDITDAEFSVEYLFDVLKRSKRAVKLVLLDQDKIGGLGNIYVNDALFLAKISPLRKANSLDKQEARKLHGAIQKVINLGIKYGGASASNYVHVSGLGGTYQDHFLVYKRDGKPCFVCETKIEKIKIGGRGSFFCPSCQK